MLSKIATTALAAHTVSARDPLRNIIRNDALHVVTDELGRTKPTVQAPTCSTSVDRLKAGPIDWRKAIKQAEYEAKEGNAEKRYFDKSFYGLDAVAAESYAESPEAWTAKQDAWTQETVWWKSFKKYSPANKLISFPENGHGPVWSAANQVGLGNCYMISAMATVAEDPKNIYDVFVTEKDNAAGVYVVKFYIRGKPWLVDVDDSLVYQKAYDGKAKPSLPYTNPFDSNGDMWGSILEKAWGKVKGSMDQSGQGGLVANGLRSLTGAPAFSFPDITQDTVDDVYDMIKKADGAGFVMGVGTEGNGNDQENNACGMAMSHAFSLITAFTMTDANQGTHDMIMLRNPWGNTGYTGTWSKNDPNWTDQLANQVPYELDPRVEQDKDGIFVTPASTLIKAGGCIGDLDILHTRDDEGYKDDWYDVLDSDEAAHTYSFTIPQNAPPKANTPIDGGIYLTVETYFPDVIHKSCFGNGEGATVEQIKLVKNADEQNPLVFSGGYTEQMANTKLIDDYAPGDKFDVTVQYLWQNSPAKDYTIKVYSPLYIEIQNIDDPQAPTGPIKKFTDGRYEAGHEKNEFTGNSWTPADMVDGYELPQCQSSGQCVYCSDNFDGNQCTTPLEVPEGFMGYAVPAKDPVENMHQSKKTIEISGFGDQYQYHLFNGEYFRIEDANNLPMYKKDDWGYLFAHDQGQGNILWMLHSAMPDFNDIDNSYWGGFLQANGLTGQIEDLTAAPVTWSSGDTVTFTAGQFGGLPPPMESSYEPPPPPPPPSEAFRDDGSVKPAESFAEFGNQLAACTNFGQVMQVFFANIWLIFSWF